MFLETTLNEQMNSFNQKKCDERKAAISLVQCKGHNLSRSQKNEWSLEGGAERKEG